MDKLLTEFVIKLGTGTRLLDLCNTSDLSASLDVGVRVHTDVKVHQSRHQMLQRDRVRIQECREDATLLAPVPTAEEQNLNDLRLEEGVLDVPC